jgi:hypothetical protein
MMIKPSSFIILFMMAGNEYTCFQLTYNKFHFHTHFLRFVHLKLVNLYSCPSFVSAIYTETFASQA